MTLTANPTKIWRLVFITPTIRGFIVKLPPPVGRTLDGESKRESPQLYYNYFFELIITYSINLEEFEEHPEVSVLMDDC